MIAPELLELLCCPVSKQPLRLATSDELAAANRPGTQNEAGREVRLPIESGLVREDGVFLYPVWDEIPCLIASEAIRLEGAVSRQPSGE
jgi:uncharacterized protein YbaR (Trm112 family)